MTMQGRLYGFATAAAFACLVLGAGQAQADGIFVCSDEFPGESQVPGFVGCIEALSAGENISRSVAGVGPDREGGAVSLGPYTLVMKLGPASPAWRIAALSGKAAKDLITISFTETVELAEREIFRADLTGVIVASVSLAADSTNGGGTPVEVVTLDFIEITWTLFLFGDDGSPLGMIDHTYNRATGVGR